eukprot:6662893-Pyramimonas_sp.AAC.1
MQSEGLRGAPSRAELAKHPVVSIHSNSLCRAFYEVRGDRRIEPLATAGSDPSRIPANNTRGCEDRSFVY